MISIQLQIMTFKIFPFSFMLLVTVLFGCKAHAETEVHAKDSILNRIQLTSPDDNLTFTFWLSDSVMTYAVDYGTKKAILPSSLGVHIRDRFGWDIPDWENGIRYKAHSYSASDTLWSPLYGERTQVRDHYKSIKIELTHSANTSEIMYLEVRAYDSGIAFRYVFPEQLKLQGIEIEKELTTFTFPEATSAWVTNRAQGEYELIPINDFVNRAERPLTLELPDNLFVSITEAQMVNFSRMLLLKNPATENSLIASLGSSVEETTELICPWRVILVAKEPGKLLENNDLILNLNPPQALKNTSFIKPGKVIREMTLSTLGGLSAVDFAAEHGLQYIHFDAGWYGYEYERASDARTVTVDPRRNSNGDLDLPGVIMYAKSKGIGVWLYVNHRALEHQLDELLPLYRKWGIAGIKFGFVHVGGHRWTTWLHEAIKKCAAHDLMVNIHDEYRPTGFRRTYPNLMTMEGIRGNEEMPDATHNTILPFTRFIAGPADYTIAYYKRKEFGYDGRTLQTTPGHQLALSVIYYSPVQWLYWYDTPTDYQGEKEIEFFDRVPTVWDDSRILQGEIGEFIVTARQSKEYWYLGAITNNTHRKIEIDLNFLDKDQTYKVIRYEDGEPSLKSRTKVKISELSVRHGDRLTLDLKASGGTAMVFEPIKKL